ncbi:MAG: response regulator transcription factor [Dehalococcoidia bacterium]|nr:response regulator transcription factor [Dehalococcoidia bacterium]
MVIAANRPSPAGIQPGLTALVVYLRPAPRGRLLTTLAELGIFVTEYQGPTGFREMAARMRADVGVLVAGHAEEHGDVARELMEQVGPSLVVCVPPGADPNEYLELGAMTALTDDDLEDVGRLAIVAQRARLLRTAPRPPGDGVVFGDIEMRLSPPALRRGRVSVPLSRSEREVVRVLAANLGRPVSQSELERHACPGVPAHPGFLKAVVLRVRRKVEEIGGDPLLLRTVRGFGYILIA